ncbi:MAG: 4Fe-4S binding protein [Clostridia bacterium]|nr:4Fe-4S binding protein [Clostridia bacterium]MBQ2326181.1 4Fe-4S binding protein [Clostridia bacterium]MBQ3062044.1 4Fe-4S binding protein [Clostridia bacterium]MBQ5812673.1 4Fe-4S binding protein [Clostridia bacterium]MBQ9966671.1 4Fe-4S binding protein [Clostridia bacterium]
MAYKIGENCVGCGACAAQCPVNAIEDNGGTYKINPDACVSCGACAAQCPVEAISEE